jgi:hypothetical protein
MYIYKKSSPLSSCKDCGCAEGEEKANKVAASDPSGIDPRRLSADAISGALVLHDGEGS